MKEKFSALSGTLPGIVMIIAVLLFVAGDSALPSTDAATVLRPQGAGRPTKKRKPRPPKPSKSPTPDEPPTTPVSNANNANQAAPKRSAVAKGNANKRIRPRQVSTVVNANTNYSAMPKSAATEGNANISSNANHDPGTPSVKVADPAEGSKTVAPLGLDAWGYPSRPKLNPDPDILLPEDFPKLESELEARKYRGYFSPLTPLEMILKDSQPTGGDHLPASPRTSKPQFEPKKTLNTTGTLIEILDKRKVFVNVMGEAGDKITARLREYGELEIAKTAGRAEFAINYYGWSEERPHHSSKFYSLGGATYVTVTGGEMIVTIRDASQGVPRIIWRNKDDDSSSGFRGNDAFNKLIKRFIRELKKLRGEK